MIDRISSLFLALSLTSTIYLSPLSHSPGFVVSPGSAAKAAEEAKQADTLDSSAVSNVSSVKQSARGAASNNDETASEARVKLEDFMLLKVIGKGSFGKVLQVRKMDTGEVFAMKVLNKDNVVKRNQVSALAYCFFFSKPPSESEHYYLF